MRSRSSADHRDSHNVDEREQIHILCLLHPCCAHYCNLYIESCVDDSRFDFPTCSETINSSSLWVVFIPLPLGRMKLLGNLRCGHGLYLKVKIILKIINEIKSKINRGTFLFFNFVNLISDELFLHC